MDPLCFFWSIEVPDNFQAVCQNNTLGPTYFINCDFNDDSDNPATGVIVSLPGIIQDKLVSFDTIPVQHLTYPELVNIDLRYVTSGIYTLSLTAVNQIDNIIVFNSTFYINSK